MKYSRTNMADESLDDFLRREAAGRICVVGVGNRMKGDDGIGPALTDRLRDVADIDCLDAGVAPENHLERIVRLGASMVILVDAIVFGGAAGKYRLFEPEELEGGGLSGHALAPDTVCRYLRACGVERIAVLGVQPGANDLGAALSPAVAQAADRLAAVFKAAF